MGIVEDVGDQVKNVKKGDRVVAAFDLGCGGCMCAALLAQLLKNQCGRQLLLVT